MIVTPAVIVLILGSWLISGFGAIASVIGWRIIRHWDINSGSEEQLRMERTTYLVSTILGYLLAAELLSLFLFLHTADTLASRLIGAMCAAGTLNANPYGYPTLIVKIVNFILCGVWLIVNNTDNQAPDYPLIRTKYKLLLAITALLILEAWWQTQYFGLLKADVITSCCGVQYSTQAKSVAGLLSGLSAYPAKVIFFSSAILLVRVGIHVIITGRGGVLYAFLSACFFVYALCAVIIFISLYVYEMPSHNCPFCLLQKEYSHIGYPMYLFLLGGIIPGVAVGGIDRFGAVDSLRNVVAGLRKRLCLVSMVNYLLFTAVSTYAMATSRLFLST